MLNQDANEFTLWEANPTSDTELVAVDTSNADVTTFCDPNAATSSPSGTGSSSSASSSPANNGGGSSLAGGAIAGIAVGAVAGIAIIAGALFFCLRKRRQAAAAAAARQPAYGGPMDQNYAAQYGNNMYGGVPQQPDTPGTHSYYKTELQGDTHPPSELQASLMGSPAASPQPMAQGPPRQHYELQG